MEKYLIAAFVGAIIGYVTNWLAIKMLFRPYKEVRIFGIKVPFTPGLMPKERYRISKSIGETVGTHLLSKETIMEALGSEKMIKHRESWIRDKVYELSASSIKLSDLLRNLFQGGNSQIPEDIKSNVKNYLYYNVIKKEDFKKLLNRIIIDGIREFLKKSPKEFMSGLSKDKILIGIDRIAEKLRDSQDFSNFIKTEIEKIVHNASKDTRALKEVLPHSSIVALKSYIYNNSEGICFQIKELLNQKEIEEKLKRALNEGISSKVSPLIAMFLNSETIYGKVKEYSNKYLDNHENQMFMASILVRFLEDFLDNSLEEVAGKVASGINEDGYLEFENLIKEALFTSEVISKGIGFIIDQCESQEDLASIIKSVHEDYEYDMEILVSNTIEKIIESEKLITTIDYALEYVIREVGTITLSGTIAGKEDIIIHSLNLFTDKVFDRFIEKEALNIIELLNIPQIIEKQINGFDVRFTEKLVLEVASRELSAITWLGALLGGIIGILSPILNSLY